MRAKLIPCVLFIFFSSAAFSAAPSSPGADLYSISILEVGKIFGEDRQDTLHNDILLRYAINESMAAPESSKVLKDGTVLIDGCRPQSCMEKAASIVDGPSKQVRAVGLLHFNCHLVVYEELAASVDPKPLMQQNKCKQTPTLEVFIIRRSKAADALKLEASYLAEIRRWGKTWGYTDEGVHVKVVKHKR